MGQYETFEKLVDQYNTVIVEAIVDLQYKKDNKFWEKFGEEGRKNRHIDASYHLPFLREAVLLGDTEIFIDYIDWARQLFASNNLPDEKLKEAIIFFSDILQKKMPVSLHDLFIPVIKAALLRFEKPVLQNRSFIDTSTSVGKLADAYTRELIRGNRKIAAEMVHKAVAEGMSIKSIYLDVFQSSQYEIGRLWVTNQISVATEHYCSAATQSIMSQLYPYLFTTRRIGKKMVAACVGGELHEIGIRMVADFFEMDGWDTYYLGANSPADSILKAVDEYNAELICLSAAMPYHLRLVKETISQIRSNQTGKKVKIMIGGRAFNSQNDPSSTFKADGYAPDAQQAVSLATKILS